MGSITKLQLQGARWNGSKYSSCNAQCIHANTKHLNTWLSVLGCTTLTQGLLVGLELCKLRCHEMRKRLLLRLHRHLLCCTFCCTVSCVLLGFFLLRTHSSKRTHNYACKQKDTTNQGDQFWSRTKESNLSNVSTYHSRASVDCRTNHGRAPLGSCRNASNREQGQQRQEGQNNGCVCRMLHNGLQAEVVNHRGQGKKPNQWSTNCTSGKAEVQG
mmetsp:Transcript_17750/g.41160  ORF Transcript_17750/g.41160 Transcript_17750/m.41160 type:complete len:215 (-) Transcript_17750:602-1246(-)